ncbi:MAG: TRAP transporter small permease [Nitrospirae bacterium]|nr:TRAP transporter small permease [Nitrospirota bacterium]
MLRFLNALNSVILSPVLRLLNALNSVICKAESALVFTLLLIMVFLSFWQVVSRNVFSKGFHWADDFLRHCVLWTGFLAASLATTDGKHIKIDILSLRLPDHLKGRVEGAVSLVAAGICVIIFRSAYDFVRIEREFAEMNYALHISTWVLELIFPVAFGVTIFKFTIKGLNGLFGRAPRP